MYDIESIVNNYSDTSALKKLLIIEEEEYSGGGNEKKLLDDVYFNQGYSTVKFTNDSNFKSQFYCGSFVNSDHYKKDRDAFMTKINVMDNDVYSKCNSLMSVSYKYKEQQMNDYATDVLRDKLGSVLTAVWSTFQGNEVHQVNHLIKTDSNGVVLWESEIPQKGFLQGMTIDNNNDVYLLYNHSEFQFDNTQINLVKIDGINGQQIWLKTNVVNDALGLPGGIVSDGNNIYVAINFKQLKNGNDVIQSIASGKYNIAIGKYNLKGEEVFVKHVLSEEPKLVTQMKFDNEKIILKGRKGNYDLRGNMNPVKNKSLTFNYGEFEENGDDYGREKHSPLFIELDLNGNIINANSNNN